MSRQPSISSCFLIICINTLLTSEATEVKLLGNALSNYTTGTVMIRYNSTSPWGTVCDDSWDKADADVVCRMLGFPGAFRAVSSAQLGQGHGDIYLDNLACTGSESDLIDCTSSGWGNHNCGHGEDAGVICTAEQSTKCPESTGLTCPGSSIDVPLNRSTWRADIQLMIGGVDQRLSLPQGKYNMSLSDRYTVCEETVVNVYDPAVIRRILLRAEYAINCTQLTSNMSRSLLEIQLRRHNVHIDEICNSNCRSFGVPKYECSDDGLIVDWLTTKTYTGASENSLPSELASHLNGRIAEKGSILHLILIGSGIRIVNPVEDVNGSPLTAILSSKCVEEQLTYNLEQDLCMD